MFVHSGASLHGHEFSNRAMHSVTAPSTLRNPLLRSTFSSGAIRTPTQPLGSPTSADIASDVKEPRTHSEVTLRTVNKDVEDTQDRMSDTTASQSEDGSEDETSVTSNADASSTSSPVRRKRRSRSRKGATYVLAHPPPRQWSINLRPNLVLQIQKVTPGLRPRPAIDVYPSCAASRSIMAPLLKCFPTIAGMKRELGLHDLMLIESEDYASQPSDSENDYDEDSMKARTVLAVICPSKTEDKAEIIMADGSIWMATTRSHGKYHSYEFTSNNIAGRMITARWVRKQNMSVSLPATPTSQVPNSMESHVPDSRFTFSFIDPNYRRHPILSTLTRASLTIPETYTAISRPADQSPPTSRSVSPTGSPLNDDQSQEDSRTRTLKEWQKSFISISAVWVALRNGWAPNFRSPFAAAVTSPAEAHLHGRQRSVSANPDLAPTSPSSEATGQRRTSQNAPHSVSKVSKWETCAGATFIRNLGSPQQEHDGHRNSADVDHARATGLNRRALSGDWHVGLSKRLHHNSLAGSLASKNDSHSTTQTSSTQVPAGRRVVSVYSPLGTLSLDLDNIDEVKPSNKAMPPATKMEKGGVLGSKCRRRKWKSMGSWFRKLSER